MRVLFVNLLLYGPPITAAVLFYFRERKRQAPHKHPNFILLYLAPLMIFTGGVAVWSFLLSGLLSLFG